MDILNPDTTITASDLESFAFEYLTALPIRGVEGRTLDPDDAWATVLHAAVEQTSIHDITEQTTDTPCSDRVLEWLATVDPDEFEDAVNAALARQAQQMLLKGRRGASVSTSSISITTDATTSRRRNSVQPHPAMALGGAIATVPRSFSVVGSR